MNPFRSARSISRIAFGLRHLQIAAAILLAVASSAHAQVARGPSLPSQGFDLGLQSLANGQYSQALGIYEREVRSAHRVGQTRFIDSICYYAMVGECEYRRGNLLVALNNFDAALNIYRQYPDWMLRCSFQDVAQVQAATRVVLPPWGKSNRGSRPGVYTQSLRLQVGDLAGMQNAVQRGGALVAPRIFAADPYKIVYATCLAMKRRRDILGPLVAADPLTDELTATTARRLGPPNHWAEVWIDVMQGIAYSVAGGAKTQQADAFLKRSLMAMGQFDHPLTAMALLELGQIAMQSNDFKTAAGYFEEATYAAAQYDDALVLEEAFQQCHLAYLLSGETKTIANALGQAIPWAKKYRELNASLILLSAESALVAGELPIATGLLAEAQKSLNSQRDLLITDVGGRFHYLSAIAAYQRGAIEAGDKSLRLALEWMRKGGSKWLFQIDQGDKLCVANPGGRYGPRTAIGLYDQLLRDPGQYDWGVRPRESLAVLTTPHPLPFEHWLETTLGPGIGNAEAGLDVADLARRHRFFSTLDFGGRTLALRWVLEAPDESLSNAVRLQRQELLVRYPKYAEAANKVKQLRAQITAKGMSVDAEAAQHHETSQKLNELKAAGELQEALLREIALRREPADMVFPPIRKMKELQKTLPPGQAMLAFFTTTRGTYAWLYKSDDFHLWKIEKPELLKNKVIAVLRAVGNYDGTRELTEQQLADGAWKDAGRDLIDVIFSSKAKLNDQLQELVIIPDDLLWYVPFELLPIGSENQPLIARAKVRYAPTVGLSQPDRQGRKLTPEYGVALGKMHPNQAEDTQASALADIQRVASGAVALRNGWTAPSPLLGASLDGLIVLDDIPAAKDGYDWTPLPIDRAKNSGGLSAWLSLPWKQIDQYILPGFHSAAENSLNAKSAPAVPGSDLFLATTGLMATGARTILISRWRVGGQSAVDLVREFVQELPTLPADQAWQRAVQLLCDSPLDPLREPRIRRTQSADLKGDHPFFWAGYMLIDTGASPQKSETPVAKAPDNKPPDPGKK
jgi:CHAT domain-containing protein